MCQTTNQLKCSRDRNVLFEGVEICHVPSHHHIPLRSMTLIFWEIEHGVWRSARKSIGFEGKASINRKLIVYTIELLEGKSLTYHHVSCFSPSSCGSKMHQATFLLPVGWMIEHPKERDNT